MGDTVEVISRTSANYLQIAVNEWINENLEVTIKLIQYQLSGNQHAALIW